MDNSELAFRILKEVLSINNLDEKDIELKTRKILVSFEEIYKKVSELTNQLPEKDEANNKNCESSFIQALKNASSGETYEEFREIMMREVLEKPEILDFTHLKEETVKEEIGKALMAETIEGLSSSLKDISPSFFECSSLNPCAFCTFRSAAIDVTSYESLKQALSRDVF
ncbi:hypothetical protein H6F50_25210 [Coleofasciculus sp. FACHB-712]|uniref:hypothetical protein n=1 Tax=Coleofasciculus sp. FACHB-712 TaxID=2692789 RepID=UPI00168274EE|nr:hypothetical protein [Coleofasciculus sp. FACHB-712]MBD1945610.1 hypothetical protein [Coleofasciculus sp. FACHB-712]